MELMHEDLGREKKKKKRPLKLMKKKSKEVWFGRGNCFFQKKISSHKNLRGKLMENSKH